MSSEGQGWGTLLDLGLPALVALSPDVDYVIVWTTVAILYSHVSSASSQVQVSW